MTVRPTRANAIVLALFVFQYKVPFGGNMTLCRHIFLVLFFMALPLLTNPGAMASDSAKMANLTIYVPGNPEGGFDKSGQALRRALVASGLAETVNIVRLPGAGGLIALANFIESRRNDPSAVFIGGRTMVGAAFFNNSVVSLDDVTPIVRLTRPRIVLAVREDSFIRDFGDLVEAMNMPNAEALPWTGGSSGSIDEMLIWEIADQLGYPRDQMRYVPTPGGGTAAVKRFLEIDNAINVSSYEEIAEYAELGRVRIIAVAGDTYLDGIAAPPLADFGLQFTNGDWRGVFASSAITLEQQNHLEAVFRQMTKSDIWKAETRRYGWESAWLAPTAFTAFLQDEKNAVSRDMTRAAARAEDANAADRFASVMMRQYLWAIISVLLALGLLALLIWQRYRNNWREQGMARELNAARSDADRVRAQLDQTHSEAATHINESFTEWGLTPAEAEIGWMLLKGLSFKEMADAREKSERTVRQQAGAIYAKSGLNNRSDLAAFFLEDFFSDQTPAD